MLTAFAFAVVLLASASAGRRLSDEESVTIYPCQAQPKPYFCFVDTNTKNPAECPPPEFDAAKNFTVGMLEKYTNAPWFIQYQAPISYQTADELFCVRAAYDPVDTTDVTAGVNVLNYANRGEVNGPTTGSFRPDEDFLLFATVPDVERPNLIRVGPRFLRPLPDFKRYYGDYWILAAGGEPADDSLGFAWAIIGSGPPVIKVGDGKPGCRGFIDGDEGLQGSFSDPVELFGSMGAPGGSAGMPGSGSEMLEGVADMPADQLAAFQILGVLFQQLGFVRLEQLLELIFAPKFSLVDTFAYLDQELDMAPILPTLSTPSILDEYLPMINGFLGTTITTDDALVSLAAIDTTQTVKLTDVLSAILKVPSNFVSFGIALAEQQNPKAIEELAAAMQGGVTYFAEEFFSQTEGEGLWLLTREQVASEELLDEMMRIVRKLGLDTNILIRVGQEGCLYEDAPEKQNFFD